MTDKLGSPFFIVGAQRSGTTMLRLMLNQHSTLCVPFETVVIPQFYYRVSEYGDLGEPHNMAKLLDDIASTSWVRKGGLIPDSARVLRKNPVNYPQLLDAIFTTYAEKKGKGRWGDKTPTYVEHIDVLDRLFPTCQVIHIVRDGRDVALSLSGISWGSQNLLKNAAEWRWKTVLGRKMGNMLRGRYLEISYERLVAEPEGTLRGICEFLKIPFESTMMDYPESAEAAMPHNSLRWHRSSVTSPDARKAGAWRTRMDVTDQILFEQAAGDALELFGYERRRLEATWLSRIRYARYAIRGRA